MEREVRGFDLRIQMEICGGDYQITTRVIYTQNIQHKIIKKRMNHRKE